MRLSPLGFVSFSPLLLCLRVWHILQNRVYFQYVFGIVLDLSVEMMGGRSGD